MTPEEIRRRIRDIAVWKSGGQRAPHKPLLLLMAVARCGRGERLIPYAEVDEELEQLLREFGPPRKSHHPEYPFWRLQNDGIWTVTDADRLETRKGNTDAKKSELLKHDVRGGFKADLYEVLRRDPVLLADVADDILTAHFPDSIHEDILSAVGLGQRAAKKADRDPAFRVRVLRAYEFRCAVCGFDVRIDRQTICLEAAHVKWRQADGPDVVSNGLALCTMHHKMLDLGAYRLSADRRVIVSERVNGSRGVSEWLLSFHGREIRRPQRVEYAIDRQYIDWHVREVFKGYPRVVDVE